jgi:type III secretion protein S
MNGDFVSLTNDALWLVLVLSAPPIVVAAVAGLIVAVIQAATQIQEQTLQYTVKFFAIVLTLFVTSALLGGSLYRYSDRIFTSFPAMIR